ncbi:MAG: PAS domain S-box protein, partial [Candidatus Bathyarchaeota archaeon]|nr:PAS domain S-box protein [Candidatus Bathyarchaeota archaeon]
EALDAIFLADPETGIIVDCNIAATKLVGRTKSELIGAHQRILHPPDKMEGDFTEGFKKHRDRTSEPIVETQIITKSGKVRDILIKTSDLEIENKRILQGTFRDITERKRAENSIKESEKRFRELTELLPEIVFETDITGKLTFLNKEGLEKIGYTPEDFKKGISTLALISPEEHEICKKRIAKILNGESQGPNEYTAVRKDGTTFPIIIHSAPILDDKKVKGIRGIIVDITEHKTAEAAIHKEKELLEMVTANNAAILVVISKDYRVLWANKQLKQIFGDIEGKSCYTSLPLRTSKCPNCGIDEILATGTNRAVHEHQITDPNGNWHCFEITAVPIWDSDGNLKAVSETILEITERKNAEQALKESEEKFRAISTAAKEGIVLLDEDAKIAYWNPASERILGYAKEDALGKKITQLLLPEHMQEFTFNEFNKLKTTDQNNPAMMTQEMSVISSSGKTIQIEISVSTLKLKGKWHALATLRDISEQKAAWQSVEQTTKALVVVNEKLGVVGKLTRHDARNKLSVILNNLYLARKHMKNCENVKPFCEGVQEAVHQIEKIFEFTRTYEMLGVEELTPTNIGTSVSDASHLLSLDNVRLVNKVDNLTVLADSLLQQLFYNLMDDSLKHGEKVSQIQVYYQEQKDHLKLVYEDNGIGIPEDEKELIFKEGYGKGTGYGLYLIKKICEAYGWTISEVGKHGIGAKFVMTIPNSSEDNRPMFQIDQKEGHTGLK